MSAWPLVRHRCRRACNSDESYKSFGCKGWAVEDGGLRTLKSWNLIKRVVWPLLKRDERNGHVPCEYPKWKKCAAALFG